MDQCEDREEGAPPSKSTLCGEHESQTKAQRIEGRPAGPEPEPSCVSLKSDRSADRPIDFKSQPLSAAERERKRSGVCEEEQLSCCALCQDVLKDPVSTSCGHWFCRQCISSYWDQSASSVDSSSPQCGERSRTRAGLQTASQSSCVQTDVGLQEVLDEHKISLRRRCERVTEGSDETGSRTLLNTIYTELYITEGQSEEVHTQHEVRQLETASKMDALHGTPIRCQDIFKALPDQQRPIRVVLTNGVAGVGKTFSVQKFTLDWAEGLENQHVSVVVLLSFREKTEVVDDFLGQTHWKSALDDFLSRVMKKSLQSKDCHLDLFVRFLHGLCLESNQRLLGGLLGQTEISPGIIQRVIDNLKKMNTDKISPDRSINIFHCLMEMNNLSVHSGDPRVPEVREQIREETL
ncbi:uncharacterized protein LOC134623540 [Pelmatolapia mariae]|uniref:uncharacterized protein LOC134623540 n=1 Tax=Pelmatolapia mariae TaxID=158779 RepID=UPI003211E0C7